MSNIHTRLTKLSPKVGVPLLKLLEAEQLNEKIVESVLNAGELAGDHSKLLAFTAGLVFLQSQHIPVDDVINMAKRQRRRINLGWSPRRWKEEHDRLSRAETLAQLATDNVVYDVGRFSEYLPEKYPGYLIRNSRRLGMEGLRQRHCIASYHQQLIDGHCAIASVFIDKKRWTVQLASTTNAEAPLRIVQVKSRYNSHPTMDIMNRIHRVLNIKKVKESLPYTLERNAEQRSYMDNLRRILPVLRENAVEHVTVRFDGSGDSGSVEEADYQPEIDTRLITVPIIKVTRDFVDGEWRLNNEIDNVNINNAIDEVANDCLEETGVDYYNNDGGWGELHIDVAAGTVELEVNVRVTNSNLEFSAIKDIESGEVI